MIRDERCTAGSPVTLDAHEALELVRWPQLDAGTLASLRHACADDVEHGATSFRLPEGSSAAPYTPMLADCSGVVCALLRRNDEAQAGEREDGMMMGRWTRQRKWGFDVEGAALYATLTGHTSIVVTLTSSRCDAP